MFSKYPRHSEFLELIPYAPWRAYVAGLRVCTRFRPRGWQNYHHVRVGIVEDHFWKNDHDRIAQVIEDRCDHAYIWLERTNYRCGEGMYAHWIEIAFKAETDAIMAGLKLIEIDETRQKRGPWRAMSYLDELYMPFPETW